MIPAVRAEAKGRKAELRSIGSKRFAVLPKPKVAKKELRRSKTAGAGRLQATDSRSSGESAGNVNT